MKIFASLFNESEWTMPRRLLVAALAVWLIAAAVYLPKLPNRFTFDDRVFIQTDPHLHTISGALGEFTRDQARLYRPLRSLILAGVIAVFGLENSLPYQLAGIIFHATLAALMFAIVWLILRNGLAAFGAGLVFALHPVHADRVANITGSFDLPGIMLGYAAWACALWYDAAGKPWRLWLAALLLALGCLASEEALMAWPLLLGSLILIAGERGRRIRLVVVLTAVVVFHLILRSVILGGLGRTAEYAAGSLGNSILTMPVILWRYVGLLFWPVGLSPAYGPRIYDSFSPAVVAALVGIAALLALMVLARRRAPWLTLGIGWFFIGLAPFCNLLPGDTLMAERYLYSALAGFAVLAGWALGRAAIRPRAALTVVVVVLVAYAAGTVGRCRVWGNPPVLWAQAATREPASFLANLNAGYHSLQVRRFTDAQRFAMQAQRLKPERAEPLLQLGEAAIRQEDLRKGIDYLQRAVAADPKHCSAYSALAQALVMAGDHRRAAAVAGKAIKCDPRETQAHYVLAYLLVVAGKCELAKPHLATILRTQPRPQEYEPARQLIQHCGP